MTNANIVNLISSYVHSIQTLPPEIQAKISNYLQSDLQQRHLLMLCKGILKELKEATDTNAKKKLLKQLLYSLVAIQDICDRRIGDMDELDDIVETHSQRLISVRSRIDTSINQLTQPGTDKMLESEMDVSDHESFDPKSTEKLSLIQRTAMHELGSTTVFNNTVSCRNSELGYRGRERLPLRAVSTNSRSGTRQPIDRWSTDIHRRKSGSSLSSNPRAMIKHRGGSDHKFSNRAVLEQRQHKLGTTYARYSRAHHQRLKNHRAMSRSIQSSRSRAVPSSEFSMQGHNPLKRKATISKYMNSYRNNKVSRISSVKRRQDFNNSNIYFSEDRYSSMKSVIEMDSNDKPDEREAYALLALNTPKKETRSPNWNKTYSENEISDDMYGTESDDSESNTAYNCKTTLSSKQSTRMSPSVNVHSEHAQRMYSLRKAGNINAPPESTNYHRSNTSVITSSSSDLSSTRSSLTLGHNATTTQTFRRGCRNGNTLRPKNDVQRSPPDTSKSDESVLLRNKCSRSPTKSEHTSEGSASPDERLYCVCKKGSFGEMIACDNKFCEVEWFHFACVDVRVQPKGKWYCPYCRGESSKIKRCDL